MMMVLMTKSSLTFLLFLFLTLIPLSPFAAAAAYNHQHLSLPPPPSPPPPLPPLPQHQLNNIIDALVGAGDFNSWANVLSGSDLFMLPLSATLFVPSDDVLMPFPVSVPTSSTAAGAASFDPLIVPYHIVPQRLTFSQLTLFKPLSRLPTLLPSKSILLTNTSSANFTLDDSQVSYPDLYLTSAIAVHGVAALLNYTEYGGGDDGLVLPPPPRPPASMFQPLGNGDVMDEKRRSDAVAGCLFGECAFVLLLWLVIWAIKSYGNPPLGL